MGYGTGQTHGTANFFGQNFILVHQCFELSEFVWAEAEICQKFKQLLKKYPVNKLFPSEDGFVTTTLVGLLILYL